MRRPPQGSAPRFAVLCALSVLVSVSLGAACDGPGNSGKSGLSAAFVEAVPWLNGGVPVLDATGAAVMPALPTYPPIASGLVDPGSQRTDCSALAGLEFSKGWFDDFEPLDATDPMATGVARGWSSYDDLTWGSFHAPGDATWYPGVKDTIHTLWGLPAERTPGPSCDGKPNDWAMHFKGGLFRKWGGGLSHAFVDPVPLYRLTPNDACTDPNDDFCPPPVPQGSTMDTAGLPIPQAPQQDYLQSHDFFDVSKYDGIAFWARRGPEGHDSSLVILTDKFTSSRLARENQKFCRRLLECHTRCLSGTPCSPDDPTSANPVYRCFDPAAGSFAQISAGIAVDSQRELMYPRCGQSACTFPASYDDVDFRNKACRPYTFPAADESGEYCWNADDPPPPSRDDRCQDGWLTSIALAPDWTFYALPWSQFGQVGFGKRAPYMDLKSMDTLAFGATMGWADVYFDNVTLYRRAP